MAAPIQHQNSQLPHCGTVTYMHREEIAYEDAYNKGRYQHTQVLLSVLLAQAVEETIEVRPAKLPRHIGDFTSWKDHDAHQHAFTLLLRHQEANKAPVEEAPEA